ncbi:MAG TPA: monofunctional biosynthetic peptidoglycan transglycosylase [Fibrobacteria bacterium]|nr:monofunctional biosynthetic peptidoglycan transglycosylase [Fibrobacteria bacterium]
MAEKTSAKPIWVKILRATFQVGFLAVKTIWLTIWTLYQIALGAVLVGLVWGVLRVGEYFSVWDIRQLLHENPKSTAFIDSERARLTDSLRAAGTWPPPDTLIRWSWVPLDSIPKVIQEVALIAEDAKFFEHQGFDLEQIEYALVANHQAGKKARGASTITQQVAKNLYLSKDKEMSRKVREAVITLVLEHYVPKERILEVYLNVAQFDEGVFGIRAASRHWLKKELADLTQDEAVNLVCLLPSPTKWNIRKPNNAFLQHKRLVMRNYAMFKGLKMNADSTAANWQDSVYSHLAEQLSDERWKGLRTRPLAEGPGDSSGGDESGQKPGEAAAEVSTTRRPGTVPRTF